VPPDLFQHFYFIWVKKSSWIQLDKNNISVNNSRIALYRNSPDLIYPLYKEIKRQQGIGQQDI